MDLTRGERVGQLCKEFGTAAMLEVQGITDGDESLFRLGLSAVIQRLQEHLAISLTTQVQMEEYVRASKR